MGLRSPCPAPTGLVGQGGCKRLREPRGSIDGVQGVENFAAFGDDSDGGLCEEAVIDSTTDA